jgi:hypothetical protein
MIAVLDIEAKNFSKRFQEAKSEAKRVALAPQPTLACIYWVKKRRYEYFTGKRLPEVVSSLQKAESIVTFNGDLFDFLVLERWCGLQRTTTFMAKSLDLCSVVGARRFRFLRQPTRKGVNLDRCGKLNFGVPRKATGTLKEKCRAHVQLTYRLFRALHTDSLMVPVRPPKDLPIRCPECEFEAELIPFQPDYEQMSEGQIWDYEIGQQVGGWGFARCTKPRCRKVFTWGI